MNETISGCLPSSVIVNVTNANQSISLHVLLYAQFCANNGLYNISSFSCGDTNVLTGYEDGNYMTGERGFVAGGMVLPAGETTSFVIEPYEPSLIIQILSNTTHFCIPVNAGSGNYDNCA